MKPTMTTRRHLGPRLAGPLRVAHPRVASALTQMRKPPLLRHVIGEVLRQVRRGQKRTLREVSAQARVSLGYLSEVERGQKEPSSELLAAICEALDIPLAFLLREVSDQMAQAQGVIIPDTVPDELLRDQVALLS